MHSEDSDEHHFDDRVCLMSPQCACPNADNLTMQGNIGRLHQLPIYQSIESDSDGDGSEDGDGVQSVKRTSSDGSSDAPGVEESDHIRMDIDDDASLRRNQHRRINPAPLFPKLPMSFRKNVRVDEDDDVSPPAEDQSGNSVTGLDGQRTPTPGIDIEYKNPNSSGRSFFEPPPLSIAYGWMTKGTNKHLEDLYLSGVWFCDGEVQSENKIEVLCEYTWVEATPGRGMADHMSRAIYVPGMCYNPIVISRRLHCPNTTCSCIIYRKHASLERSQERVLSEGGV